MFVVLVSYRKPLEVMDKYLASHVAFLEEGYKKNYFIVSGRRNPRIGGVIISQLKDRNALEDILKHDPFYVNGLADYEVIEFTPRNYHPDFKLFVG
jgi:uncharacterized protein YciI